MSAQSRHSPNLQHWSIRAQSCLAAVQQLARGIFAPGARRCMAPASPIPTFMQGAAMTVLQARRHPIVSRKLPLVLVVVNVFDYFHHVS